MENFTKELVSSKDKTLKTVVNYIVNTVKAKALYKKGGWKEVRKEYADIECFNHNFSISATAICIKLRENKEPINLPIQANMKSIEMAVNSLLDINAVEYYVDRKNHALKIVL
mgnify:CR=1 FL=1|jgi:hypothetical protein|tara:strand:- start:9570 stop:9908 length:339 start_codon:yes stop_codon:yes gene_type:complete